MRKSIILLTTMLLLVFTPLVAQEYVGSENCRTCHSGIYNEWKESGHPYKLQKLEGEGPTYPAGLSAQKTVGPDVNYTIQPGVPKPPKGYTWEEVGWVLGGYHSNARFIDTEGYVIIGDSTRYHIPTDRWVAYDQIEPGKKPYSFSCFKCHTTGASSESTTEFEQYPGIQGSWVEAGVGCEACHGPAGDHVTNISNKPPKEGYDSCNQCHARDRGDSFVHNLRVEWTKTTVAGIQTGFIRHREQGDMMYASKHHDIGMTCATCHNPHKSVYYEMGGVKDSPNCQTCHPNKEIPGHGLELASCTDCHMPFVARNADAFTPYVSEQSAHYWNILTDPITRFDNLDTTVAAGKYFIKVDENGKSGLTLDYTCLQCHVDKDVDWAAQYAPNMHQGIVSVDDTDGIPSAYTLAQNYPNPFNPTTVIDFSMPKSSHVTLNVYAITGQLVQTLIDKEMKAGRHSIEFNGENLASGVYIYSIKADKFAYGKKMILMK